jgi:hypothetical protein
VSAQTQVYLFNQRQLVVLVERNPLVATRRYEKVYSKNLTISRGVDNILEFAIVNQDQKPVNISGKEITCRILNADGTRILLQKTLTPLLALTGITSLQLTETEIETIQEQYCYYSLEFPVNSFNYPVFVDSQGGARGVINIVDSVLPEFVESKTVTIPSHLPPEKISDNMNPEVAPPNDNGAQTYYSSVIGTIDTPTLTVQMYFDEFTGNVEFQGSTLPDFAFYYEIDNKKDYVNLTDTKGFTLYGFFPYVRVKIKNYGTPPANDKGKLKGDVTKIIAR